MQSGTAQFRQQLLNIIFFTLFLGSGGLYWTVNWQEIWKREKGRDAVIDPRPGLEPRSTVSAHGVRALPTEPPSDLWPLILMSHQVLATAQNVAAVPVNVYLHLLYTSEVGCEITALPLFLYKYKTFASVFTLWRSLTSHIRE